MSFRDQSPQDVVPSLQRGKMKQLLSGSRIASTEEKLVISLQEIGRCSLCACGKARTLDLQL